MTGSFGIEYYIISVVIVCVSERTTRATSRTSNTYGNGDCSTGYTEATRAHRITGFYHVGTVRVQTPLSLHTSWWYLSDLTNFANTPLFTTQVGNWRDISFDQIEVCSNSHQYDYTPKFLYFFSGFAMLLDLYFKVHRKIS